MTPHSFDIKTSLAEKARRLEECFQVARVNEDDKGKIWTLANNIYPWITDKGLSDGRLGVYNRVANFTGGNVALSLAVTGVARQVFADADEDTLENLISKTVIFLQNAIHKLGRENTEYALEQARLFPSPRPFHPLLCDMFGPC